AGVNDGSAPPGRHSLLPTDRRRRPIGLNAKRSHGESHVELASRSAAETTPAPGPTAEPANSLHHVIVVGGGPRAWSSSRRMWATMRWTTIGREAHLAAPYDDEGNQITEPRSFRYDRTQRPQKCAR